MVLHSAEFCILRKWIALEVSRDRVSLFKVVSERRSVVLSPDLWCLSFLFQFYYLRIFVVQPRRQRLVFLPQLTVLRYKCLHLRLRLLQQLDKSGVLMHQIFAHSALLWRINSYCLTLNACLLLAQWGEIRRTLRMLLVLRVLLVLLVFRLYFSLFKCLLLLLELQPVQDPLK